MKLKLEYLRKAISNIILESHGTHRCIDGSLVPDDSMECLEDLSLRIEDAEFNRNSLSRGSADRSHYNGILANLRKKKRRLTKNHGHLYHSE